MTQLNHHLNALLLSSANTITAIIVSSVSVFDIAPATYSQMGGEWANINYMIACYDAKCNNYTFTLRLEAIVLHMIYALYSILVFRCNKLLRANNKIATKISISLNVCVTSHNHMLYNVYIYIIIRNKFLCCRIRLWPLKCNLSHGAIINWIHFCFENTVLTRFEIGSMAIQWNKTQQYKRKKIQ